MNYTVIKLGPVEVQKFQECQRVHERAPEPIAKTDSFTVLPPLSPQIPGPPSTPNPNRILPPISRKRSAFVILQEVGSRPVSTKSSPSGRTSPFRGYGFKPSSSSREVSPCRRRAEVAESCDDIRRSRSRLPIAWRTQPARQPSKSVSPVGSKTSNIPRPLNRRISYSPNRAKGILSEVGRRKTRTPVAPLRSSENLLDRISTSSNFRCDVNGGELRKSTPNLRQPPKPPLPRKPTTAVSRNECRSTNSSPTKTAKSGVPTSVPLSPTKKIVAKTYPNNRSRVDLTTTAKNAFVPPRTPVAPKSILKSPAKTTKMSSSTRSKENLSPTKAANPTCRPKPPTKSPKKSSVIRKPTTPRPKSKVEHVSRSERNAGISAANVDETTVASPTETKNDKSNESPAATAAVANELDTTGDSQQSASKKGSSISSSLLNALKITKNRSYENGEKTATENESTVEEKKEFLHTDTSRSLPILIRNAGLTESSVTLIRTTTEPALAPLEPNLISEIRSAMIECKVNETVCITQDKRQTNCEPTPLVGVIQRTIANDSKSKEIVDENEPKKSVDESDKTESKKESMTNKGSPRMVHVNAAAVTEVIDESSKEITSNVVKIKQAPDIDVLSGNNLLPNENRNGTSKSSWLKDASQSNSAMKTARPRISPNANPSTENLLQCAEKRSSCWKHCTPTNCFRKTESTPVQINAVTNDGNAESKLPHDKPCYRKYCCCFCFKCRLKEGPAGPDTKCCSETRVPRCCENDFKNVFDRVLCKKKKSEDFEVACVGSETSSRYECTKCTTALPKCFGIFCCLNTAFCMRLRSNCKKMCSCCKSWYCCSREKTAIAEQERRRSTISNARKRKWTRVFTDFPKLDVSFVEHGSIMRGAIPVLPVPLAWFCLILNVFLPGFGTLSSGILCMFVGKPRFSINDSIKSRIGSFLVNLVVAGSQLFTVLFCLVGWGWSIWWGVIMLKIARKHRRIMMAEQAGHTPHSAPVVDQNHDAERGIMG